MYAAQKEENTADILAHMEFQKGIVCSLINIYLAELADPDKLHKASIQQLAISMGIVIDKFTGMKEKTEDKPNVVARIAKQLFGDQPADQEAGVLPPDSSETN